MALRGAEGGDCPWEYDAPQFVDFSKLSCTDMINDEEYFSVDHELRNPFSNTKAVNKPKTVDNDGLQIATASPGMTSKKLSIKPVELACISKIKHELNAEFCDYKTDVVFKENIGESSSNLLDSAPGFSTLHDTLNSKPLPLTDVFKPTSPFGKIQVVHGLEKKKGETLSHGPTVPLSSGKTSIPEDRISSLLPKPVLSAGKAVISTSECEAATNKVSIVKMGKMNGDRGRTMKSNCRVVDQVTSAKKRLSMSVDRGRDRLRLVSPSPPIQRERSLERKDDSALQKAQLPSAIPISRENGACHSLAFHKTRSVVKSQMIVESQIEMTLDEKEFVRELTENNLEAVEEERLNRTGVVPHTGVPFQLLGARVTLPAPFSFEERMKQSLIKKEEKIRKFLETERKARGEFHAQPFPEIIYSAAQPKKMVKPVSKPPTKPVPFQLHLHNPTPRAAAIIEEPKQTFRAKPANVLHKEPFIPHKAAQRTTDFLPLSLNTKQRAEKRAERDRLKQEKEVQTEQERLVKDRQRKEQEEQELRKLRAATVHKANPIRYYKPVAVVHSAKSSTIPKSPTLSRKSGAI